MHAPAHGVRKAVQQRLHKTLNFISPFLLSYAYQLWPIGAIMAQQARTESIDYNIYGSVNMSFKSTKFGKSSSDWLNSVKAVIQHWSEKKRFSCFRVLPSCM